LVEGLSHKLEFPKDHYFHSSLPVEWWYLWGRTEDNAFFHFATFRVKLGRFIKLASHYSFHNSETTYGEEVEDELTPLRIKGGFFAKNNRFFFSTPKLSATLFPISKPLIHREEEMNNYYSIPFLEGTGQILPEGRKVNIEAWFDHEFKGFGSDSLLKGWDWLSFKLRSGVAGMCHKHRDFCHLVYKDNSFKSKFILEDKHLYINELGSYLTLEPINEERIFTPNFGLRYSEQPVEILAKGEVIGYGMRERTYAGGKDGHS
jgi:hypothetical protein